MEAGSTLFQEYTETEYHSLRPSGSPVSLCIRQSIIFLISAFGVNLTCTLLLLQPYCTCSLIVVKQCWQRYASFNEALQ